MTQDQDRTLGHHAASKAKDLEAWTYDEDSRGLMEDFAATGMTAEVGTNGTLTSAYIVLQPGSPRMEFEPFRGVLRFYDNGDRHTTHVGECEARDHAADLLAEHFDGLEIEA